MIRVKRPAEPLDVVAFQRAIGRPRVQLREYATRLVQAMCGPSGALYLEGAREPVALVGLYPAGDAAIAWFAVAALDPRTLVPLVWTLRRHLRAEAALWRTVTAEVAPHNPAGARLAAALGFELTAPGDPDVWTLRGGR